MAEQVPLYFIIHKPYGVLSQFSDEGSLVGLGSLYNLPKDVYPVGRLDSDSEGLLILTNDKSLNNKLLHPSNLHKRTYWVEIDGVPTIKELNKLKEGVKINLKGKMHLTAPCTVRVLDTTNVSLQERTPPVNRKKHPITSWIELELIEGKNRQVRRMTAQVGHPTLRLIRVRIENLLLGDLPTGGIRQISKNVIYTKLNLKNNSINM
jgi:23S rRNA pseudouridine2457 synthase